MKQKIDHSQIWNAMQCSWQDKLIWFYLQKHDRPDDKALRQFIAQIERELNQWEQYKN